MSFIGGLSNGIISEGCPMGFLLEARLMIIKNKNLLFWKQFSYMENGCVRESVRTRDMGHEMWTFM